MSSDASTIKSTASNAANSAMSAAGSAVNSTMSAAGSAVNSTMSAAGSVVSSVSKPLAEPSRTAYGRFQEGMQWYFEHWEDLVHEARAEHAHDEHSDAEPAVSADGILKSLSDAKVASDIPGRVRLRVAQLKGQDKLTEPLAETLGSIPGVKQVEISSLTGSILMVYDKKKYPSREALLSAMGA
ncbi:MAG: hypothetical protein U0641_03735 [Anaerolineae bacterium]